MRALLALLAVLIPALIPSTAVAAEASTNAAKKVYILPIRDDIMPPLVYLVRRGVKEAMEAKADLLVLDMETNGGRVDTTREIISILNEFKGETVTFVNKDAFSAGAFIAVATKQIYMAPESVIGAAAPIIMSPGGDGVEKMPDTYEKKMTSAVKAMVRTTAEKNGHNIAVVEAMIDKTRGLVLTNVTAEATNAVVIAKEGDILTLTNTEAEKEYGNPPKRLLSSGTVKDLDTLIAQLGYAGATTHRVDPTGMERIGSWLNVISPLLLIIGIAGIYIEFKTPGLRSARHRRHHRVRTLLPRRLRRGLVRRGMGGGVRPRPRADRRGAVRVSRHDHHRDARRDADAGGVDHGDGGFVSGDHSGRAAGDAELRQIRAAAAKPRHRDAGRRTGDLAREPAPAEDADVSCDGLAIRQRHADRGVA
jgi:ATP-dependent protease ClpP protease subunit